MSGIALEKDVPIWQSQKSVIGGALPLSTTTFWQLADTTRMAAEYQVDENLRYLRVAPLDRLQRIFLQYRFFTIYYITDLALLVSKLPFGSLRSCLAEFLSEELGDGDPTDSHPTLYDDFLLSLGVPKKMLELADRNCLTILDQVRASLVSRSWPYGVGLRGMGGECLCQIYLASMHLHFTQNPVIDERKGQLAWKFWDIHTGDVDVEHRERTRAAIDELINSQPETITDLAGGYLESKAAWDGFWQRIFTSARLQSAVRKENND